MRMKLGFSKCVIYVVHVVTDVDFQPIRIQLLQVDVDINTIEEGSLHRHEFDTTQEMGDHRLSQQVTTVWADQPPLSHLHVYMQLRSPCVQVGWCKFHSMFKRCHHNSLILVATPPELARPFHQVGEKLYRVIWGKQLQEMLLDVPDGSDLKYMPQTWVNELGLRDLGYNEQFLLICREFIFAFDSLTLLSPDNTRGGVVVTGQPGIGTHCILSPCLHWH